MNKLTYHEAYNKIIEAYFKDEIKPYSGKFCFCGTLAGFNEYGGCEGNYRGWPTKVYNDQELQMMENALLITIFNGVGGNLSKFNPFEGDNSDDRIKTITHPNYEDALFNGMCKALEVLKEIHRSRGENVDDVPVFTKRQKV